MSNTERAYESLVFRIEQLEQDLQAMVKHIAQMKCQLDDLSEQVNNQPELLQKQYQLQKLYNERQALPAAPVEVVNLPTQEVSCSDSSQPQPT